MKRRRIDQVKRDLQKTRTGRLHFVYYEPQNEPGRQYYEEDESGAIHWITEADYIRLVERQEERVILFSYEFMEPT